jgi:mono/diheme cytochrome c family protein
MRCCMKITYRLVTVSAVTLLAASTCSAESARSAPMASLRTFLDAHCIRCHGPDLKKGGLDLEALALDCNIPAVFDKWLKVHDRIQAGEMPPRERKQRPSPAESEAVLKTLNAELTQAELARRGDAGRAVLRRLNRTEYENTLRDLLSLPGLRVKDMLPEDGQAFGFDKSAASLDLSYVQLARYMEAAEAALDAAIAPHAARPAYLKSHIPAGGNHGLANKTFFGQTVFLKDFKYDDSIIPIPEQSYEGKSPERKKLVKELSKHPYTGSIGVFKADESEFKPKFPFTPLVAGKYKIRMSLWSFLWDKGEVKPNARTEVGALVTSGRTLGYFDAPSLQPTVGEIEVWLDPHEVFHFNASSLAPAFLFGRVAQYVRPGIAVDWLEIEGPLLEQWPPASHRRLFDDLAFVPLPPAPKVTAKAKKLGKVPPHDVHIPKRPGQNAFLVKGHDKPYIANVNSMPQRFEPATVTSKAPEVDARRLLADFLPRAFRRPVAPDVVERYVELVKTQLADGDVFEVAMRTAYKAALCAPDFLYLKEPAAGALDQWALASRLSYFLWNSMPDGELLALAEKGKLRDAAVLRAQVERMLKDPRAERFVVDFTDQWLTLAEIDATTPDRKLYPEFRRILRDAMLAETRAFFRELVDRDLSASNVIDADFAMLNQRLAEHYGIPGVVGSVLRRVALPSGSGRGGILTQASVLKVTANGTVTSPVKRGAWVQRQILGQPPEPPPPDVPAIEPDVRGTTSIREMLASHRNNAGCAVCHNKIDPPGFALESFDVIGGRRTRYRSLGEGAVPENPGKGLGQPGVAYRWGPPVDAAGETADGRAFNDVEGFKKLLLKNPHPIARNLVGQLIIYATGAPVAFADRAAVETVLARTAARHYGVRSLIHEIVQSPLFLNK